MTTDTVELIAIGMWAGTISTLAVQTTDANQKIAYALMVADAPKYWEELPADKRKHFMTGARMVAEAFEESPNCASRAELVTN